MTRLTKRRPVPDDFAAIAPVTSLGDLIQRYASSHATVTRWLCETGTRPCPSAWVRNGPNKRAMPADFPEIGPTLTLSAAARRWQSTKPMIARWHRENGSTHAAYDRSQRRLRQPSPVPDDFAAIAPTLSARDLMKRYHVGARRIRGWCKAVGVSPRPIDRAELARLRWAKHQPKPKPFRRQAPPKRKVYYIGPRPGIAHQLPRDDSAEGRAADHLRRFAPLYRCDAHGRADPKGSHWSYGYSDALILTPQEMMERAAGLGFDADGWRRVA